MIRKIFIFLIALLLMAAFYVFALMMEDKDSQQQNKFLVQEEPEKLVMIEAFHSQDSKALAKAFGVSLLLPEDFQSGGITSDSYHGYTTRLISLSGSKARVSGIRPASAAASLYPKDAAFTHTDQALLGFRLMQASTKTGTVYSLMTPYAAFLIEPLSPPQTGSFTLTEP